MTDIELLMLAAKAIGLEIVGSVPSVLHPNDWLETTEDGPDTFWNPLQDDGDALRLAVKLRLTPMMRSFGCDVTDLKTVGGGAYERWHKDMNDYESTRRAIVRAAAEIGKGIK